MLAYYEGHLSDSNGKSLYLRTSWFSPSLVTADGLRADWARDVGMASRGQAPVGGWFQRVASLGRFIQAVTAQSWQLDLQTMVKGPIRCDLLFALSSLTGFLHWRVMPKFRFEPLLSPGIGWRIGLSGGFLSIGCIRRLCSFAGFLHRRVMPKFRLEPLLSPRIGW